MYPTPYFVNTFFPALLRTNSGRLGSRWREYIGADPDTQAAALARVKAWDELQAVKNEMREMHHRLAAITGHLARALLAATNGFDPYW